MAGDRCLFRRHRRGLRRRHGLRRDGSANAARRCPRRARWHGLGLHHRRRAHHPAVGSAADPDAVLPAVRRGDPAVAGGAGNGGGRKSEPDAKGRLQRTVPGCDGVIHQLLRLVLAAAPLPGLQPGGVLLHDPVVRRYLRRPAARRAAEPELHRRRRAGAAGDQPGQ
ncbi:hypothetical protein D3C78_1537910 [compost metagenome]